MSFKDQIDKKMFEIASKTNKKALRNVVLSDDKIKDIVGKSQSVFKYAFLILESIVLMYFFLKLLPSKFGWDYSQTAVLTSIMIILFFNSFKAKNI